MTISKEQVEKDKAVAHLLLAREHLETKHLIAELERRRHELCPKCANGKSVLCVECVWAGVYRAYRKDDNFKEAK